MKYAKLSNMKILLTIPLKRLHWFNPFERLNRALRIYKQIIIISILGIILNNYKEVYFRKIKKYIVVL